MFCCLQRENVHNKKRPKNTHTTSVIYDKSLIEFPLDEGLTRFDYCPLRCTICLMGILKKDAKAGPCITHVFHAKCIDKWSMYCLQHSESVSCPNCLEKYKNIDPLYE